MLCVRLMGLLSDTTEQTHLHVHPLRPPYTINKGGAGQSTGLRNLSLLARHCYKGAVYLRHLLLTVNYDSLLLLTVITDCYGPSLLMTVADPNLVITHNINASKYYCHEIKK